MIKPEKIDMCDAVYVAIGAGRNSMWQDRFAEALDEKIQAGYPCRYRLVNMDSSDWFEHVRGADVIIWKPSAMGPRSAGYVKEKIYFLQYVAGKLVVPNFESIWHFESKLAQHYFFSYHSVPFPSTVATFDYRKALQTLDNPSMPVVFKTSEGASSSGVRLIRSKDKARTLIKKAFFQEVWMAEKEHGKSTVGILLENIREPWLWRKVLSKLWLWLGHPWERLRSIYWQEFVPGNDSDLRITAIGNCYAYGAWRNNRSDDFRASGSGSWDYQRRVPEAQLRYCLDLNTKHDFDSMCYDIIFTENSFVITEMSYAYVDSYLYEANGYYVRDDDGSLAFIEGHTWPQELWIEWALRRLEQRGR